MAISAVLIVSPLRARRFLGLVAEGIPEGAIAVVSSGTDADVRGTEGETGDSGRRFITSEPIQDSGEGGQRGAQLGGVARVVQVAMPSVRDRTRPAEQRLLQPCPPWSPSPTLRTRRNTGARDAA